MVTIIFCSIKLNDVVDNIVDNYIEYSEKRGGEKNE